MKSMKLSSNKGIEKYDLESQKYMVDILGIVRKFLVSIFSYLTLHGQTCHIMPNY